MLDRLFSLHEKLPVPPRKENPPVLVPVEPAPQEPVRRAAPNAGTDREFPWSGTRQGSAQQRHAPSQETELEHAVKPTTRRFFE
jgi:hypothetical protein